MDNILRNIKKSHNLSPYSLEILLPLFTRMEYKKGDELIRFGKHCQALQLIEQGYCRAYNIQNGEEVNINFYFEHETVTHKNSYLFNIPADFTVVACEPMIVHKINKADLLNAIKQCPELEIAGKRSLELIAAKQEKQLQLFRILTAKGRYEFLEKNEPELLQRVPISQLASYLGVKRETLSRIRNKRMPHSIL